VQASVDRRRIGTIGLVYLGRFAGILVATVIGFIAAADTSSSFFIDRLRNCAVPTAPPYISLFTCPLWYPLRELPV